MPARKDLGAALLALQLSGVQPDTCTAVMDLRPRGGFDGSFSGLARFADGFLDHGSPHSLFRARPNRYPGVQPHGAPL
jgi:hypothetical protein